MLDLNQRPKDYETNQGSEGPLSNRLNPCQPGSIRVKAGQRKSFKINNLDLIFAYASPKFVCRLATLFHSIGNFPRRAHESISSAKCIANQGDRDART